MPIRTQPLEIYRPDNIILPKADRVTLTNGMQAIVVSSTDIEICRLTVMRRGGTAEASDPAVALMAAQLQQEGTATRTGAEIAAEIDFNGSWFESVPTTHHTRITTFALPSRTRNVLPPVIDMVFNPSFDSTELRHLKRKLMAASREQQTTAPYIAARESARITFGTDHPLARAITPEGIAAVRRADIVDFHNRFCRPDLITLFVTGNITDDQMAHLDATFGAMPMPQTPAPELRILPIKPSGVKRITTKVDGAPQAALNISIPTIGREHPDYVDLRLAVMALGGYFGSRLSQNIREERGLTYGIGASLIGMAEGAVATITTECRADAVDLVIDEVNREISRLASEPPAGDEINRLRNAETTALLDIIDTPFSVTDFYQTLHTTGLPYGYFDSRLRASLGLTSERIAEVAARHLRPEDMLVSVAAP